MKKLSVFMSIHLLCATTLWSNPWNIFLHGYQQTASYFYRTFPIVELYKGWSVLSLKEKIRLLCGSGGVTTANLLAFLNLKGIASGNSDEPIMVSPLSEHVLFTLGTDMLLIKAVKLYLLNRLWIEKARTILEHTDLENAAEYQRFIEEAENELHNDPLCLGKALDQRKEFELLQRLVTMAEETHSPEIPTILD